MISNNRLSLFGILLSGIFTISNFGCGGGGSPRTVVPPLSITTTSLPGITAGGVYNTALQVSGGVPPYSWSRGGLAESATWTVNFEVPPAQDVPEIVQSVPKENPVGSEPELMSQLPPH